MEPVFNEEEQNEIIDIIQAYIPKQTTSIENKISKYDKDIAKVMSLLSASVVSPNGEQSTRIDYMISEEDYRLELQTYAMSLIRNDLKNKI